MLIIDQLVPVIRMRQDSRRLRREAEYLDQYFSTVQGIATLIQLFYLGETDKLTEPSGIIHADGRFEDCNSTRRKKQREFIEAVYTKDTRKLGELASELEQELLIDERASDRQLFESINRYINTRDNATQLLLNMREHFSSATDIPTCINPGDIFVHVHQNRYILYYDNQGNECTYKVVEGYSSRDISVSFGIPVGLIEYSRDGRLVNGKPITTATFKISHVFKGEVIEIGELEAEIHKDVTYITRNGSTRTYRTPRIRTSRFDAYNQITEGGFFALPILEFDPKEDYKEYFRRRFLGMPEEVRDQIVDSWTEFAAHVEKAAKELIQLAFDYH